MPPLEIALATHDGARFLPELLESLERQTCQDFRLLIADDASSDGTLALIEAFAARHPDRVEILRFAQPAGGASANFARLIARLGADYAMFCDQDDVWLPHKVELSLGRMRALEAGLGPGMPIAFHTDLAITGPDLEARAPSYWGYANVDPAANSLGQLLLQNSLTGCAAIVNRRLYELARPIPDGAMYDGWIALVAAAFGRIEYERAATILHRRHGRNASMMERWDARLVMRRALDTLARGMVRDGLIGLSGQARLFLERFGDRLPPKDAKAVERVATIWSRSRLTRCTSLLLRGPRKRGLLRNIGFFLALAIG